MSKQPLDEHVATAGVPTTEVDPAGAPLPKWVLGGAIVLITIAAFAPVLENGFVNWGDRKDIVDNPHFRGLTGENLLWMATAVHMGHYQPLTWLSFALDYAIWNLNPTGYHLTSLLLHAACALAVYVLLRKLLRLAWNGTPIAQDGWSQMAAAAGALLFALHPLRVEAVAWATERRGPLSALFYLLAILSYLRYAAVAARTQRSTIERPDLPIRNGRGRDYRLAVLAMAFSLLAKEFGVSLPLVLLVLDVYPLRRLGAAREWIRPRARHVIWEKWPFVALALVGGALAAVSSAQSGVVRPWSEYGLFARIGQCFYGLAFYLAKTVFPHNLSPIYSIPHDLKPFAGHLVAAAVVVTGVTTLLIALRRRFPAGLAAWVAFVVILLPVLGLLQTGRQIAADRYTYLPAVAISALAAGGMLRAFEAGHDPRRTELRRVVTVGSLLALAVLTGLTLRQTRVWRDSLTLWNHALRVNPACPVANDNMGTLLVEADRPREAESFFQRAIANDPTLVEAYNGYGVALARQDRLADAIAIWQSALRIHPDYPPARANLDRALQRSGR
ncbi:MAG TPA: tetratricopeptide repeat protein [Phycisphaerae bacterium]